MRLPRTFLIIACILLFGTCISAAIIGIDFGSEFTKVSSVAPGSGFHIVLDEQSKRKISTCVAFDESERLFGNGAISLNVRRPSHTYQYFQRLLGKTIDSPQVAELKALGFPYEFVTIPERNSLGVRHYDPVNKTEVILSVEEIVAMSLQHIQHIAEVDAKGQPTKDCVITVPGYWTQKERQALLDAADIAGWNVLSLINENTAAAIQYGLDRKYVDNETYHTVFYNMGATGTQASLVTYTGVNRGTAKKEKIVGSFEVRGTSYDPTLGGQAFESRIVSYIVNEVEKQLDAKGLKQNLYTLPKVMAKIRNAAEKAKVVLSANSDTHIVLGSLLNDLDFRLHLTRDHFYSLATDLLDRVVAPLQRVIEEGGMTPAEINSVVIIGGGVRVPAVQAALKKFLGRDLAQNLNGDEAFTFGAVFRAANLSTAFQVRALGMVDITPYPVGVRITDLVSTDAATPAATPVADDATPTEDDKEDAAPAADKPFTKRASLFTKNNRLSKRKTVTLSHTRDVIAQLFHDNPKSLPYGMTGPLLYYNVTGISDLANQAKYTELLKTQKPRVSLTFALDASGITTLSKAEAQLEEQIKVLVPKIKPNITAPSNSTDTNSTSTSTDDKKEGDVANDEKKDDAAAAETPAPVEGEATKNETVEEPEYITKKKTHSIALKIKRYGAPGNIQPFTQEDKIAAKARLDELKRRDQAKKEIAESKNALESHIYGIRNILSDEDVEAVSTEAQREAVSAALTAAEEWLYEQTVETAPLFRGKLSELKVLSDPIIFRKNEAVERPKAFEQARNAAKETKELIVDFEKNRPWVKAEDRTELSDLVVELEKWLDEQEKAQSAVATHDEPVVVATAIIDKIRPVAKLASTLLKQKKPIEKPKPKIKIKNNNSTDADNSTILNDVPLEGEPIGNDGTEPIVEGNTTPTEETTETTTETPTEPPKDEL